MLFSVSDCGAGWNKMETDQNLCFHFRDMYFFDIFPREMKAREVKSNKNLVQFLSLESLPLSHNERKVKQAQKKADL